MAHVDDLTLITADQMLDTDLGYLGRPGDPDPDRRYTLDEIAKFLGGNAALITALSAALPIEYGTWTPTLGGSTGNPAVVYSTQAAQYVRIGRLVVFALLVSTTSYSGGSGNIRLRGLPYVADSVLSALPVVARPHQITWASGSAQQFVTGRIPSGGNAVILDRINNAGSVQEIALSAWPTGSAGSVAVSGAYLRS